MNALQISVTKRDGSTEPFNADQINKSIERACKGLSDISSKVAQIGSETQLALYDGVTTKELDEATINTALQNVKEDIEYDKVATRLLLKTAYKEVLGDFDNNNEQEEVATLHKNQFKAHIELAVKEGLLDERMLAFDLGKLAEALNTGRDDLFVYSGLSTLLHRYTMKADGEIPFETPQFFFMRVAMGLSYNEKDPTAQAIKFYDKFSKLEYLPGGSTNLSSGTVRPAMSNCFLIEMHDDMEHIAKTTGDVLRISKATGGIGLSLTQLRATGSRLKSSNTVSSGPVPFAKIMDIAIRAIVRGGKKKGALALYMESWHYDFPSFIDLRHNAGDEHQRMRTANTACVLTDEFMKRVESGEDWYMFDPNETRDLIELYGKEFSKRYAQYCEMAEKGELRMWKKDKARSVYRKILVAMQTTSHPWITWKGAMNVRALNNNTGTIHMSNLCTEICLPQDRENIAVCNLCSVNIAKHINEEAVEVEWQKLEDTVRTAIRHLDNLIDINILPVAEAQKSDQENRAIGMGVMGIAELFEKFSMAYDSPEAYDLCDQVIEFISYIAIDESANLAQERGSYSNFKGSRWSKGMVPYDTISVLEESRGAKLSIDKSHHHKGLDWDALRQKVKGGIRNATLMAVAPNANIGLVAGTTPGFDPRFSQVFARKKFSGKYMDLNKNLVDALKAENIWEQVREDIIVNQGDISEIAEIPQYIRDIYKTSFGTDPIAFLEIAARAQKWIDQAISRNMYLSTRNVEEMMRIYSEGWKKGVKTTYYLHMKPRHTAEQSTTKVNKTAASGRKGFAALRAKAQAASANTVIETVKVTEKKPTEVVSKKPGNDSFVCPVDPAEKSQCDSCQ